MKILSVSTDNVLVLDDCGVKNSFPMASLKAKKLCRGCKKEVVLTEAMVEAFRKEAQLNRAWVEVLADANTQPQRIELTEGKHVIGRHNSAQTATLPIKTDDLYVHRQHCYLEVLKNKNGDWECILSKHPDEQNGTFLNTRQLDEGDETYLKNGDLVSLCDVVIRFVIPAPVNRKSKDNTVIK